MTEREAKAVAFLEGALEALKSYEVTILPQHQHLRNLVLSEIELLEHLGALLSE